MLGADMKKERLFYLDFIRAIATVAIVLTHYNAIFYYNVAPPAPEKAVITMTVANIYIGGFGVSLFLIVSGASLMYVYEEKLDVKKFYKKRFLNIFPMFWLAYAFAFLYNFYTTGGIPQGIPKRNIIFSVLGLDTWLVNFSVPTFGLVAEWFLGLIIIVYIVFPVLRWMVNEHPVIMGVIAALMYGISIWKLNSSVVLFARLPELLFGMYFVKYMKKVNWKTAVPAAAILVLNTLIAPSYNNLLQVTYVGICSFLVLVWLSYIVKWTWIKNICKKICKYSYACFIIHHFVIYKVVARFNLYTISVAQSYLLFMVVCIAVGIATYLLYHCHDKIMKMLTEKPDEA